MVALTFLLLFHCQATKTKRPIVVAVTLMDGRTLSLPVDSASTSGEICKALAKKVQLSDTFGFSLFVSMYEKVMTLLDDYFTVPFVHKSLACVLSFPRRSFS